MMKWKPDFKQPKTEQEPWYDIIEDWELIDASFTQQYGIRLSVSDMSWYEFCSKLQLLNSDTPLGQIVKIRAEDDPKSIKEFSPEQKKIRMDYRKKKAKTMDMQKYKEEMKALAKIMESISRK